MADKEKTPLIYARMAAVMKDIGPIAKGQKNKQQGFMYRGIDDIYNALNEIMAKHEVFNTPHVSAHTVEERKSKAGGPLFYHTVTVEYTFYTVDGSSVLGTVVAVGMDSADKGIFKALAGAHKYMLTQTFVAPTADAKDGDAESHEVAARDDREPERQPQSRPQQQSQGQGDGSRFKTVDVVRFGDHKKQKLADLETSSLENYAGQVSGALDRGAEYVSKEHLDAIHDEINGRESAPKGGQDEDYAGPPPHSDEEGPF